MAYETVFFFNHIGFPILPVGTGTFRFVAAGSNVRDASKINTLPEVEAPTVTKQSIRYSDWTVPAPLEPRAVLLAPGGFGEKPEENQSRGYVDFGIGNYLNMVGNAGYRILQKR